jgi:uncharacterized repeat protein (TIGR01451 family)
MVYPVSGGNNSFISLPSLNVINVDSVTGYDAAYPAVTTPASGYFGGGQTVYVRAVVSDPFGSFDITSATVTIKNPYDTAIVTNAAMTQVADSGAATKTYEYAYVIPTSGPAGSWTAIVTAKEGTENNVSDSGNGGFNLGLPNLVVVKSVQAYSDPVNGTSSPKAIPGSFMLYTILATNAGRGAVDSDSTVITDPIPSNTELYVGDLGGGCGPVTFTNGPTPTGLSCSFVSLGSAADGISFSNDGGSTFTYTPAADANQCDAAITHLRISLGGVFSASDGANNPSFDVKFRVRVK